MYKDLSGNSELSKNALSFVENNAEKKGKGMLPGML
jgi:hypothetical protein